MNSNPGLHPLSLIRPLFLLLLLAGYLLALRSTTMLRASAAESTYQLTDRFLFAGSDSVFVNDTLLGRDGYTLDYSRGILLLRVPVRDSALVIVSYQHLPVEKLENDYLLHTPPAESAMPVGEGRGTRSEERETMNETTPGELTVNGAKTITASFGNSGLGLDQALRLNVNGDIAGVKLDAILSDQSAGIPAEGTTRELSELDKVLVNFTGSNVNGAVGDYDFLQTTGRLGSIARSMRGAEISGHGAWGEGRGVGGGLSGGISYSKPKGRFGQNQFPGEDGKQGPYEINADLPGITIVPGSEAVYLDGRLLVRGWDNDYTIDYSLGELTFTNHHQITSQSRVEIDYQYTTDEYDRTTIAGNAEFSMWGERRAGGSGGRDSSLIPHASPLTPTTDSGTRTPGFLTLRLGAFQEGDDPNAHLNSTFDSADQALLSAAGPDTNLAGLPGADSVGFGHGSYVREGDHFRFVPRDSGDFNVQFSLVGSNGGDYVYDNAAAAYRYVGGDSGQYAARRIVRLPEQDDLYFGDLSCAPLPGLFADFTGALGRHSRNLFAPSGIRTGLGYDVSAGWQPGRYGISYQRRSLGTQFSFPGQISEPDFTYTWNLAQIPAVYSRDQVSGFAKPIDPVRVEAGAGWLCAPGLNRQRDHLGVSAWFANYNGDIVGRLIRHDVVIAPKILMFYPNFHARFELDTLQRVMDFAPELGFKPGDNLQVTVNWERQAQAFRESLNAPWLGRSLLNLYRGDAHVDVVSNLDLEAIAGYQRRTALTAGESDFSQFFGNLVASYTNPAGLRGRVNFDQKNEMAVLRQAVYVKAVNGKGQYSQNPETHEYYPDTLGEYIRELVPSGPAVPTLTTVVDLSGGLTRWQWFSLDLSAGLDRQTSDSSTLLDRWSGNASFQLLPYNQSFSTTLTDNVSTNLDEINSYIPERDFQNQPSVEIRIGGNNALTGTARVEFLVQSQTEPDGTLRSSESGINGLAQPTVGYGVQLELRAGYGIRNFDVELPVKYGLFELRMLTLGARRRFELPSKTALNADLSIERRTSDIASLPYDIQLTDPLGWLEQLTLGVDHMLGSTLVLSGNYTFMKRPDRAAEHNVSASLKAYF